VSSGLPDPPDPTEFPYSGWVPTVNSRLSFRHIGESRNPCESRYANVTTDDARLVLAYQHRPLSDALFKWIVHPLRRLDGSFYFVLTARSEGVPGETEELRGAIFIYKSHEDWKAVGRAAVRPRVQAVNLSVHTFHLNRDSYTESLFRESEHDLTQTSDIIIRYRLFRTGEVYFGTPKFNDSELESESVEYAAAQGQDFNKGIADQCYFFLRDITHTHQHHAPSSDTILILQYRHHDDVLWRRNIVYSLNHHIIRSKRFADAASLFQAMGVLSYCQSFKSICQERFGAPIPGLPIFNDDALLASLRARADERTLQATERATDAQVRISRAANWRLIALTFTALLIALLAIFVQPLVDKGSNEKLTAISKFASENLLTVAATLFLFLLFVWALTQSDWQVKHRLGRDLLEFSNVRRVLFIALYLVAAVMVVAIALYFAGPAIADMMATFSALWNLLKFMP
jgi:hypothetical protein